MHSDHSEIPPLDPFAFPSETKGRFLMLIVTALAFGADLGILVYFAIAGNSSLRAFGLRFQSVEQQWRGTNVLTLDSAHLVMAARHEAALARDAMFVVGELLALPAAFLLLLTLVAIVIYRGHGRRFKLQYRTRPLTRAEAPTVVTDLERCAERFGLPLPSLEYSPGLGQGHAFGARGQEVLLLHGTPESLEKSWGESSRVIALHELGHVANVALEHDEAERRGLAQERALIRRDRGAR